MDNNIRIASAAVTDRGLSQKRPQNEDAYLELDHCGLYAVADGVGGAQAGDVASQMAMEILAEAFNNLQPGADAETVMRTAIERANSAIYQMSRELPQLSSMATTVVALHLAGNIATIGHVGDSRLYRVDRNGNFYRETDDHSMVADEVRAGRMTEEQAENHPSRNIISRALGAEETVAVDLKTIMVDAGSAFLLCSDGITRHVSDQEIKGVLTFGGGPFEVCEYLKELCYHRGAEDNLTAVVVRTASAVAAETGARSGSEPVALPTEIEYEEPTIAATRPRSASGAPVNFDEDLLELDTAASSRPERSPAHVPAVAAPFANIGSDARAEAPTIETEARPAETADQGEFSMFGSSGEREVENPKRSGISVISAALFFVLGAVIGIGAYYFAMAPQPIDTDGPRLSEMRAANIPLSAFEENRRNVDRDPANYIARFGGSPQDSEDFYLLGRAFLLTGDYARARDSLTEARNRLSEADPTNSTVLASDIAVALAVTNDTTIQSMLRKELEYSSNSASPPANTANTAANTATQPYNIATPAR